MSAQDEPIRVERKRYAFWPQVLVWRGRRMHVHQVERCWTVARGSGRSRCERRYFRLRCNDGAVTIYHDVLADLWWLDAGASLPVSPIRRLSAAVSRFRRALGSGGEVGRPAPQPYRPSAVARGGC